MFFPPNAVYVSISLCLMHSYSSAFVVTYLVFQTLLSEVLSHSLLAYLSLFVWVSYLLSLHNLG